MSKYLIKKVLILGITSDQNMLISSRIAEGRMNRGQSYKVQGAEAEAEEDAAEEETEDVVEEEEVGEMIMIETEKKRQKDKGNPVD